MAVTQTQPHAHAQSVRADPISLAPPRQRIVRERRQYNKWVATQTLEDYALRYTADKARRWSPWRIGNTALGPISFLACEAIGGALTLQYGFANAVPAILLVCALMFAIGVPIIYYAARNGLDIDLLTRGAGFGYMGSTITSLIYASFTFLLFSIEASIMSAALALVFGLPLWLAHLCSALVVIPIAVYGISLINRMQIATQPIWLLLQLAPIVYFGWLALSGWHDDLDAWVAFPGAQGGVLAFAMAASTLLALLPQIGEQADYLRFLPKRARVGRLAWWSVLIGTGPGWVGMGSIKLLAGSFLAVLALRAGVPAGEATQPVRMFSVAFDAMIHSPAAALALTGVFVIVCQLKINVTNAYAGSIAWSNFFSRLTHAHPGRVVWLVFNVLLALLLMELGVFRAIESVLVLYANFAVGWIGALTADLVINKPLGFSPRHIEFKRAYLYDINPVGVGAMLLSILVSTLAFTGFFGPLTQALSPFVGLVVAFVTAPLLAWWTKGRYYLARKPDDLTTGESELRCTICENFFEPGDVAMCPAYDGPICSLCCTLEARCHDTCKEDSRFGQQITVLLRRLLPEQLADSVQTRIGHFLGILGLCTLVIGALLSLIYLQYSARAPQVRDTVAATLWIVFFSLLVLSGVIAWLIVLTQESRNAAQVESARQTAMLMDEIQAHGRTDAALEKARRTAEAANEAKSRYVMGLSHEIRSPLNAIFGYAQLLEREAGGLPQNAVRVIRRSAEHLSNLVDGLLDIAQIENGLLRLNRDRVPFPDFLDQLVDMFRVQTEGRSITFRYRRAEYLPAFVHADEKRLRQVLINLLSNAVKFTERGYVEFSVSYRGQVALFEIADSGIGIRAQDLEDIFKPFERGGLARARAAPGAGLGLAITKVLVEIMGGEIKVRSTPGEGSRFDVRLMLSEAAAESADAPADRRIAGYLGPRRRILVVDDDAEHLALMRQILEGVGFTVLLASDGESCLELAAACQPDLVTLDITMPGLDGWSVAKTLRESDLPDLKIMMVSANAHDYRPSIGADGSKLHDDFLTKPFDVNHLIARLGKLLGIEWRYDEPARADAPAIVSMIAPPGFAAHRDELQRLGSIGHVRAIEARLQEIAEAQPDLAMFVLELQRYVASFDLRGFMGLLDRSSNSVASRSST